MGELDLQVITSSMMPGLASNAVLLSGEREAVLIDTPFVLSDSAAVVEAVRQSGKRLTTVLITHAHPDHYFGIDLVREAFGDVHVLARRSVIDQICEFKAKLIHWQELVPGQIPTTLELPDELDGCELELEGQRIEIIDLFMIESLFATAFYLPESRTLVAGDLVYAGFHHYMSDVGDPDAWIGELDRVRRAYAIDRLIPGHGGPGGSELLDESIEYLEEWKRVAQPGVRFVEIAQAMMERYPGHQLALLLWLTRGPGFGLAGAAEIGVPPELLGG